MQKNEEVKTNNTSKLCIHANLRVKLLKKYEKMMKIIKKFMKKY